MDRVFRFAVSALVAAGVLAAGPVRAQGEPGTLIIGTNRILKLRAPDTLNGREWTVEQRINHVHDVFPKYLGGPFGKITSKKWGDRIHLYLNNEFVLAVTPADAQATGYKTTAQLAEVWARALQRGFNLAHVRVSGAPEPQ